MPIESIDHIYAETTLWDESVAFWTGLGFDFAEQWGSKGHRAGRLVCGLASITLAEVAENPEFSVFFDLSAPEDFQPGAGVEVRTALQDTHWGTRWIRVADPDGRVHSLEAP